MQKKRAAIGVLFLAAGLAACTACGRRKPEGEKEELIVFAAASMTETLTKIGDRYMEENESIKISFNFDSSGTLKTQIEEGAPCDLFISAGQKQMDQLDITADPSVNTGGLDFVEETARKDILENKVALCAAPDNPAAPGSFGELADALEKGGVLLAMGNSDVPVGQYTRRILDYYGLREEELSEAGLISYGSNVKEVTTQILEGSVDCGVIYCTDAYSAGLQVLDEARPEMCGRAVYPAAVLKGSQAPEEAERFLDFMLEPEQMAVFEEAGFVPATS